MAVDDSDAEIPDSAVVFTFGRCKFNDNIPGKFWLRDESVTAVACGDEHTAVVSAPMDECTFKNGKLFTFGDNSWGQCGLGHTKTVRKPSRVKDLKDEKVVRIACGKSHTLAVTDTGALYSFGANDDGQLGLKPSDQSHDEDKVSSPAPVPLSSAVRNSKIRMLSAGAYHSALLTEKGHVYVWGTGSEGQLGLGGEVEKVHTPTLLPLDHKVVHISCGYYHTAVVTEQGELFTCGEVELGKLGLPSSVIDNQFSMRRVESIEERVVSVSCGHNHTAAITENGAAYTFGECSSGQLGRGNRLLLTGGGESASLPSTINWKRKTRTIFISCGEGHTAVVTASGRLYMFGDGRHGKLALGEENFSNQCVPTLVTRFNKFRVLQVACGGCHSVVIARPRGLGHDDDSSHSSEDDNINNNSLRNNEVTNSVDLSGSILARSRRREKLPENDELLKAGRALPQLTISAGDNPLNRSQLPGINGNDYDNHTNGIDMNGSAAVVKKKSSQQHSAGPQPKPRALVPTPVPRSSSVTKDRDSDSSGADDEDDDDDDRKNVAKKMAEVSLLESAKTTVIADVHHGDDSEVEGERKRETDKEDHKDEEVPKKKGRKKLFGRLRRKDKREDRQEDRQDGREDRRDDRQDRRDSRQDDREDRRDSRQDNIEDRRDDRQDRRDSRQDNREDRRDSRQDNRQDRRDSRQDSREDRQDNRQDRRDSRQDDREDRRGDRGDRREDRQDNREDRRDDRQDRRDSRQDDRGDRQEDRQEDRQDNKEDRKKNRIGRFFRRSKKEDRQDNREDRQDDRQDNREDRQDDRQDNREDRQENRQDNREDRQDSREERRDGPENAPVEIAEPKKRSIFAFNQQAGGGPRAC